MVNDVGTHMIVAQIEFYGEHFSKGTFSTASTLRITCRLQQAKPAVAGQVHAVVGRQLLPGAPAE